jgi:hypothetical protein
MVLAVSISEIPSLHKYKQQWPKLNDVIWKIFKEQVQFRDLLCSFHIN